MKLSVAAGFEQLAASRGRLAFGVFVDRGVAGCWVVRVGCFVCSGHAAARESWWARLAAAGVGSAGLERGDAFEGGGELVAPGPGGGEVEGAAAAGAGES